MAFIGIDSIPKYLYFIFSLFTLPHERQTESFIQNKIFNLVDLTSDTQQLIGTIFGYFSLLTAVKPFFH